MRGSVSTLLGCALALLGILDVYSVKASPLADYEHDLIARQARLTTTTSTSSTRSRGGGRVTTVTTTSTSTATRTSTSSSTSSSQSLYRSSRTTSSISSSVASTSGVSGTAPQATLLTGQDTTDSKSFLVYNVDAVHYPYTVHLPDRDTRGLAPLDGPPPLLLSLSGSGARGTGYEAKVLSGYDGASRKIREYNAGNRTLAHTLAAEEFLTVTPICPNETDQANAQWDVTVFPNILAQVVQTYEVDLTRVYLSTYSMGARAAWNLLMQNPDIFAGTIISSGGTQAQSYQLAALLNNSIRNYYGGADESGLEEASITAQENYNTALQNALANNATFVNTSRVLETEDPIPDADHLVMTDRPWDEDILTDGYTGALSWLLTQVRPEGANIPAYNYTVCTTCIPAPIVTSTSEPVAGATPSTSLVSQSLVTLTS